MQSIAAVCCGAFLAASSQQDWVWACYRARPKRCRSPWKKISETRPTISGTKRKPWLRDRRRGPFANRVTIIIGAVVVHAGFARGTAAAAYAAGGEHSSAMRQGRSEIQEEFHGHN